MDQALKYLIDDEVSSQASFCHHGKACLSDSGHRMCEITQCVNREVHFVCGSGDSACNYRINFGNSYICSCPVRVAIYQQYKV